MDFVRGYFFTNEPLTSFFLNLGYSTKVLFVCFGQRGQAANSKTVPKAMISHLRALLKLIIDSLLSQVQVEEKSGQGFIRK